MIGHFEVICASSPHIYHSALVLTPKESTVWKLYEPYTLPFIRVVQGTPIFTAAKRNPSRIYHAVWSPCNSFIAIASSQGVDILDSTTLQDLQTLKYPSGIPSHNGQLAFSPDGCILSFSGRDYSDREFGIVGWDLQTGGIVSVIKHNGPDLGEIQETSLTYSADGKMLGLFHLHELEDDDRSLNISIFDAVAGMHIHSHSFNSKIQFVENIWVHGGFLQFATADGATITIWEARSTLGATPTVVHTIPAPPGAFSTPSPTVTVPLFETLDIRMFIRHLPTSYTFACAFGNKFQVWDAWHSKYLREYRCPFPIRNISWSPDGCFLACSSSSGPQICLWKKSPAGYILHGETPHATGHSCFCFSQDGRSMATWGGVDNTIQSWHIKDSDILPPAQAPRHNHRFLLNLSLDKMVAAVAMFSHNVVIVLDLKHGTPHLTIDMGMSVLELGVVGSKVFVVCEKNRTINVVSWNLPTKDCIQNARVSCEDSSGVVVLPYQTYGVNMSASISPDSHLVGLAVTTAWGPLRLIIHNLSTGEHSNCGEIEARMIQFSPDGCSIWCAQKSGEATVRWAGNKFQKSVGQAVTFGIDDPPEGYPWASPHGCWVTNDWWILDADGKRLLMLPAKWRSGPLDRRWKGQFLALLHWGLQEAVILDLDP